MVLCSCLDVFLSLSAYSRPSSQQCRIIQTNSILLSYNAQPQCILTPFLSTVQNYTNKLDTTIIYCSASVHTHALPLNRAELHKQTRHYYHILLSLSAYSRPASQPCRITQTNSTLLSYIAQPQCILTPCLSTVQNYTNKLDTTIIYCSASVHTHALPLNRAELHKQTRHYYHILLSLSAYSRSSSQPCRITQTNSTLLSYIAQPQCIFMPLLSTVQVKNHTLQHCFHVSLSPSAYPIQPSSRILQLHPGAECVSLFSQ